jgi:hypothetical protein
MRRRDLPNVAHRLATEPSRGWEAVAALPNDRSEVNETLTLTATDLIQPRVEASQQSDDFRRHGLVGWVHRSRALAGVDHGFLLDQGTLITLDVPESTSTQAFGLNNDGQVVELSSTTRPKCTALSSSTDTS